MGEARPWVFLNEPAAVLLLTASGGFVDAAGYLAFFGLFTSSITGNLVAAAAGASLRNSGEVLSRTVVLLVFLATTAVGGVFVSTLKRARWSSNLTSLILFVFEAVSLVAAWAAGVIVVGPGGPGLPNANSPQVLLLSSLCAIAMALQCVAVKVSAPAYPATTVITSSLVSLGTAAAAFAVLGSEVTFKSIGGAETSPVKKQFIAAWSAFIKSALPIAGFTIGAFVGAALYDAINFHSFCVPCAIVLVFIFDLSWQIRALRERADVRTSSSSGRATANPLQNSVNDDAKDTVISTESRVGDLESGSTASKPL
jgi:uncharacterized membrane protein YoaK (UPF0700 family)